MARRIGGCSTDQAARSDTGPIARTVGDAALLLGVIAGHDRRDPGSLPIAGRSFAAKPRRLVGLRIGFSPDLGYAAVAGYVRAAFKHAIDVVDMGAELTTADPGVDPDVLEGEPPRAAPAEGGLPVERTIRQTWLGRT
jgi:aspartyl-tRNA(Asn)/glutamyl-tRNA(Gln) amidotransferase subunit A